MISLLHGPHSASSSPLGFAAPVCCVVVCVCLTGIEPGSLYCLRSACCLRTLRRTCFGFDQVNSCSVKPARY